ncbi:Beta-2-microglobulin Precursor [Channa argus]|uniref:Beta-2-microglobulin n=1 Tax=Channa argus TaxID=215402 RepID=A0A6G1QRD8_CHAAH|nr:Beta-2-microglobulin Precursor [Channa argus]
MKLLLWMAALLAVYFSVEAKYSPPKVQVYSRDPGEYGKDNTFICHASKFHPPDIKIQLLKNDVEIPGAKQTDLAFKDDWHFVLTRSVNFRPEKGDKFICRVTHGQTVKDYVWEPNM